MSIKTTKEFSVFFVREKALRRLSTARRGAARPTQLMGTHAHKGLYERRGFSYCPRPEREQMEIRKSEYDTNEYR